MVTIKRPKKIAVTVAKNKSSRSDWIRGPIQSEQPELDNPRVHIFAREKPVKKGNYKARARDKK